MKVVNIIRPNREPGLNASAGELLEAVDRRIHKARRRPAKLARERVRLTRGLVGPIADHYGTQALRATAELIEADPSITDIMPHFKAVVDRSHAVFNYSHVGVTIRDGAMTGLAFPLNYACTYLFQRSGSRDWGEIRDYTPQQIGATIQSRSFQGAVISATLPHNGVWATFSSEVEYSGRSLAIPRSLKPNFSPDHEGMLPEFKEALKADRTRHNRIALATAKPDNEARLSNGCPVAHPHKGPPNIYERAAIAVLQGMEVDQPAITFAMRGGSIRTGFELGQKVCEITERSGVSLPPYKSFTF
jgi:hypothetical protein